MPGWSGRSPCSGHSPSRVVMDWVADHRKHHAHTDAKGSAQPPRRARSGLAGLWHAHVGWLLETQGRLTGSATRRSSTRIPRCAGSGGASRCSCRLAAGPDAGRIRAPRFTLSGAAQGLVWGGLVRIFFVHHITWSVNSVCHFFGSRRFDVEDHSTNVAGWRWSPRRVMAPQSPRLPALCLPWVALVGARPSGLIISGMERVGLAWNVVRITPERQRARTLAGVGAQGA